MAHTPAAHLPRPLFQSVLSKLGILRKLKMMGPGLVAGASDDDPSCIATHSQVGARFGMDLLWTSLYSLPLKTGFQQVCARIGRTTGRGIAGNIRKYYPNAWLYPLVIPLFFALVINLSADIAMMGEALALIIGGPVLLYSALLAIGSLTFQILVPYQSYVKWLRWLTLALLGYAGTVLVVQVPWGRALGATLLPPWRLDGAYLTGIVAVLGTHFSPYVFFWQASEEVEAQEIVPADKPLKQAPRQAPYHLERIRVDTRIGMAVSNLITFFIILAVAVTLHAGGVREIGSASQAAEALRPAAGPLAFVLFTLGILGTGLLAVPVLAGAAAYAVAEALHWPVGLQREPRKARGFYGVIAAAVMLGLAMNFLKINPMQALFWAAVVNGVIAGPIMVVIMRLGADSRVMGQFTLPRGLKIAGWAATAAMLACTAAMAVIAMV